MAKYRKKPVVIEALQFVDHTSLGEICDFMRADGLDTDVNQKNELIFYIPTEEGIMAATQGDWVIKGVAGEFYPCKPEIFAATYELVD